MTLRSLILPILCALLLQSAQTYGQSNRNVKAKFTWEIADAEETEVIILQAMVPTTIEGRQRVNSVKFSAKPVEDIMDEKGDRYVVFSFRKPDIPAKIVFEADMQLFKSGFSSQKMRKQTPPTGIDKYLGNDKFAFPNDPKIKALAAKLKGSSEEETISNIIYFIAETLEYSKSRNYKRQGNIVTLETKKGICNDYCDLMIALCRANGMPARISGGYMFQSEFIIPGWDDDKWHAWVEVYMTKYGWVPFDPTRKNPKGWQSMGPNYIYVTRDVDDTAIRSPYEYKYGGWKPRIDSFISIE